MRRSYRNCGLVYVDPLERRGGRPILLDDWYVNELHVYLQQRPTAYLDELVFFLWDEFELDVSESTVYRALKRSRWSRKVQRKMAAQRNIALRTHWQVTVLPQYRADQLVFLDESAACERTGGLIYLPYVNKR